MAKLDFLFLTWEQPPDYTAAVWGGQRQARSRPSAERCVSVLQAFDAGAELAKLLVDPLVTALNLADIPDA
jgi:hypothetical protein